MKTKILVFSDSHGKDKAMRDVISRHRSDVDYIFFLGDGNKEFGVIKEDIRDQAICVSVRGNCDIGLVEDIPSEMFLNICGFKLMLTHGDQYGVKYGFERLIYRCRETDTDIALFGHTHIKNDIYIPPDEIYSKPLRIFNPGSISRPIRENASFGLIVISDGQIITNAADYVV